MSYPINKQFVAGLTPFLGNLNLKNLIEHSIALEWDQIVDSKEVKLEGFYLASSDQILSLYIISNSKFSMMEISRNGDEILVTIPLARIQRTVLTRKDNVYTFAIELDADSSYYDKDSGAIISSVYLLNAPVDDSITLLNFARSLNSTIQY